MHDGGWCWYQDPRAVIHNGKLIIGATSGVSGDIRVGVYDLEKGSAIGEAVLHKNFEVDDHNTPAFFVRPDGRVLAMYAKHGKEKIHYYCLSDAEDYLQWTKPKCFVHKYDDRRGVTYMNLHYMEDESTLYNFFRDGLTFRPWYMTSQNHGDTWGNPDALHSR